MFAHDSSPHRASLPNTSDIYQSYTAFDQVESVLSAQTWPHTVARGRKPKGGNTASPATNFASCVFVNHPVRPHASSVSCRDEIFIIPGPQKRPSRGMQVIMYLKIKSRGKCVLLKVINDLAATISMIRLKETVERPRIRGSADGPQGARGARHGWWLTAGSPGSGLRRNRYHRKGTRQEQGPVTAPDCTNDIMT